MMKQGELHESGNVNADVQILARQTLTDVVNMTQKVKQAIGTKRLQTAAQVAEFLRVIVGSDVSRVAAGGGYYCQTCWTQPKHDMHWTVSTGHGKLSGWWCGPKGHAYCKRRMAGVITFTDKEEPSESFVLNTKMAEGKVANMISAMKVVNMIRNGEFQLSDEDVRKMGGLGPAIKVLLTKDSEGRIKKTGQLESWIQSLETGWDFEKILPDRPE